MGLKMAEQRWLPIESNPSVMNQFLHKLGMPITWAMTDVYGLDDGLLDMIPQPAVALLLLFPINEKYENYVKSITFEKAPPSLYYMKQTISNACGTVAMIHSVANTLDSISLEDGSILKKFLEATKDASPEERAKQLEDSVDYHFIA